MPNGTLVLSAGSPTQRAGANLEDLAVHWLTKQGLRCIARNARWRGGEIDLIAWHEQALVFFEVRLRSHEGHGGGAGSVSYAKRRRIVRSAQAWLLKTYDQRPWPEIRFDVLLSRSIGPETAFEWLQAAFDGSGNPT